MTDLFSDSKKWISGLSVLLLLLIGWLECTSLWLRLSYSDAAFYFFNLTTYHDYFTPHHRYMAVMLEYLPLMSIGLGGDFETSAMFFGLDAFVTYVFLLFMYYRLTRDSRGFLILVLAIVYGMAQSYYYYVPEHLQYFLALYLVFVTDYIVVHRPNYLVPLGLICLLIVLGSNLFVISLYFLGLFYLMVSRGPHRGSLFGLFAFVLLGLVLYKIFMPASGYETGKIKSFLANLQHWQHLDKSAFRYYTDLNFDQISYFYIPALAVASYAVFLRKYFLVLAVFVFYTLLYYLTCVYFFEWDSKGYINLYGRLSYLSMLIPLYLVVKNQKAQTPIFLLITATYIAVVSGLQISKYKTENQKRYSYLEQLISTSDASKIYVNKEHINYQKIWYPWATPYETMLVSRRHGTTQTVYIADLSSDQVKSLDSTQVYSTIASTPIAEMVDSYYRDLSAEPYTIISKAIE